MKKSKSIFTKLHTQQSWLVPVPMRSSKFTSLLARHEKYNVETSLGEIKAFSVTTESDLRKLNLAYADLQINPEYNGYGRLGSGRSAFYKGAYLKGIGRTQLAANWCLPQDAYHHSGHLLASAGLREHISTCWLKHLDFSESIVPCEGILLKTLEPSIKAKMASISPKNSGGFSPVDFSLQALTVKEESFCRWSNLLWLLKNPNPDNLDLFFTALDRYLPQTSRARNSRPEVLVDRMSQGLTYGLENFIKFIKSGLMWGSLHNNFTLDGKFLDLEVPHFFGEAFLGIIHYKRDSKNIGKRFSFLEVLGFRTQMKDIFQQIHHELQGIKKHRKTKDLDSFLTALQRLLYSKHMAFSDQDFIKFFVHEISEIFKLSRSNENYLRKILQMHLQGNIEGDVLLTHCDLSFLSAAIEFQKKIELIQVRELQGSQIFSANAGIRLNQMINEFDQLQNVDDVLNALVNFKNYLRKM